MAFAESEQSKIFPNAAFGYWKVMVERPLRLRVELSDSAMRLQSLTLPTKAEIF